MILRSSITLGPKVQGGGGGCMSRNGTAGFNLSDLDGEALKSM